MPETIFLLSLTDLEKAWPLIAFYVFILGFFYLFLVRPQSKRNKQHRELMDSLDKGDRFVTAGGIPGAISRTKGDIVHLDIGKGVLIRVDRGAIRKKEGDGEDSP